MPAATVSPETVRAAQILLTGQGIPVQMDGILGEQTRRALREFQRRRKLPRTGALDAATLRALGLPVPDEMSFERDETDVPPFVLKRSEDYSALIARQHQVLVDHSRDALANFATTMSTASTAEASPDLGGVLLTAAYRAGVETLKAFIEDKALGAGVTFVLETVEGVRSELERAAAAVVERRVAAFVKAGVRALAAERDRIRVPALVEEVSLAFLESRDRPRFLDALASATDALAIGVLPSLPHFELPCYEAWINMHFNGFKPDGQGVVAYRFGFDGEIEVQGCSVEAPLGDRIEDELNAFLENGAVNGVSRPIDLRVHKRACFGVMNPVGLVETGCGWLTGANAVAREPVLPGAKKAFAEPVWRIAATRFF